MARKDSPLAVSDVQSSTEKTSLSTLRVLVPFVEMPFAPFAPFVVAMPIRQRHRPNVAPRPVAVTAPGDLRSGLERARTTGARWMARPHPWKGHPPVRVRTCSLKILFGHNFRGSSHDTSWCETPFLFLSDSTKGIAAASETAKSKNFTCATYD